MSNLLKKNLEPAIAAFGFPVIRRDEPGEKVAATDDEVPAVPEISSEQLYRTKLLELERKTQEIEKEAYGKGFAQGEKDGYEYGNKAAQVIKGQLERLMEKLEALPSKILEDYREWLILTSLQIARRIVKREVQTSPEIVADIAKALLDEAEEHSTLTVYFNPNDLELIEKKIEPAISTNKSRFAMKADRNMERGGCRVESALQLLDASLDTRFAKLEQHLLENGSISEPGADEADE